MRDAQQHEKDLQLFEKTEMCKKNIYRLCHVKRLEQDINRAVTHTCKMHEN